MKQVFLSVSFKGKEKVFGEIETIKTVLSNRGYDLLVFVDKYQFAKGEEKKMMDQSRHDINNSKFLIAEVSDKAIGVGIEIGYAAGMKKPVLYLRKADAEYSTTVGGIAGHHIVYESCADLHKKLDTALSELLQAFPHP